MRQLFARPAQEWSVETAGRARRRQRVQWMVFFAVTAGIVSFMVASTPQPDPWRAPVAIVALWLPLASFRAFTGWWFALDQDRTASWRGWTHAGIASASLATAMWADATSLSALFYVIPTMFIAQSFRSAAVSVVGMHALLAVVALATGSALDGDPSSILMSAAASAGFSLAFGWPIDAVGNAAVRNAELAARLDRQQTEIARLSHAEGAVVERERLARELHDTVTQGLASIVALSHAASDSIGEDDAAARAHIARIRTLARENLDESRRVVAAVGPGLLEGSTLADAVTRTVESFADRTGITGIATVDADLPPLPPATSAALLRVCQQALANAEHHASASRVDVSLREADGAVTLTVADDGVGFDAAAPAPEPGRGRGLPDMASRLEDLGGAFVIVSQPGAGTRVTASIDVKEAR